MKKLKLNLASVGGVEILTRDQLKKLRGGHGDPVDCTASGACPEGYYCPEPPAPGYTIYCSPIGGGSGSGTGGSGDPGGSGGLPGIGGGATCGNPHYGSCPGAAVCVQGTTGAYTCV